MPTTKKRVNLSLSDQLDSTLEYLANRDQMPKASKVIDLIQIAIEIDEDLSLADIAKSRDDEKSKFLSHEEAWS